MPTNIYKKAVIDTEPDIGVGIKLPLDNEQGGVFTLSYSTAEQAISNLKNLLLTNQGERVMQPTFGTTIQQYLFQPVQQIEFSRIRRAIETAIKFWLPYIIIEQIEVDEYDPTGNSELGVYVYLLIRVTESGANIPITLLYTTTSVRGAVGQGLPADTTSSTARTANTTPRTSNFNRVLIT